MALGSFHSRTHDPKVAMYPIQGDYNMPRPGMLPLFSAVRKFFDLEVQIPVGFLTRPVTGYGAQHDAGYGEYAHDDQCDLHIKYICYGCSR